MSKTTLEQKKCMQCETELYSFGGAFYCGDCEEKVKWIKGKDLELFECARCGKEQIRESNYHDSINFVSLDHYCSDCEKFVPILFDYYADNSLTYDYELFDCLRCKGEFVRNADTYGYEGKYEEYCGKCTIKQTKIDNREQRLATIQRLKNNAEKRKLDVFPNIFAHIESEIEIDYRNGQHIKKQKSYVFRCGYQLPIEYYHLESAIQFHVYDSNCISCKVLAGKSKATVMTQDHVMKLFKKGIFGKSTKQFETWGNNKDSNYKSVERLGNAGQLVHYNTTEAIRTNDGTVIENFQCWSAGWAKCSISGADYDLPLTTLEGIYSEDELLTELKVLDDNEDLQATLFRVKDDYLLFGRDLNDNSLYMVKIPSKAQTVSEALEVLKPNLAKGVDNVQRQGDIFFIPLTTEGLLFKPTIEELELTDSHTATWYDIPESFDYEGKLLDFFIEKLNIKIDDPDSIYEKQEKLEVYRKKHQFYGAKCYKILLEYAKANKRKCLRREKRNNAILSSNHIAEKLKTINGMTYVQGEVKHGREQHTKFILETWHIAVKNLAVTSWQIAIHQGGGHGGYD